MTKNDKYEYLDDGTILKKLNLKYAVESKCADCMHYWADGKKDCQVTSCSLYAWQQYRELEPDVEWRKYSPRKRGRHGKKVEWKDILASGEDENTEENVEEQEETDE